MALFKDEIKLRKYESDIHQLTHVSDGWMINAEDKNNDQ